MGVKIVAITENNIAKSAEAIRESFLTVSDELGLTKEKVPTNGAFLEDDRLYADYQNGIKMYGLFEDVQLIGFMALEQKENGTFYLEKLAVLPNFRHSGYGRMLINHASELVKQAGGSNISIGIIYENKRLLKWYEECGFIQTGIQQFPHLPFTVCFMGLDL